VEPTRYKRKGQAKKFMATNYTEGKWEGKHSWSDLVLSPGAEKDGEDL
jgi:hypothetical protein